LAPRSRPTATSRSSPPRRSARSAFPWSAPTSRSPRGTRRPWSASAPGERTARGGSPPGTTACLPSAPAAARSPGRLRSPPGSSVQVPGVRPVMLPDRPDLAAANRAPDRCRKRACRYGPPIEGELRRPSQTERPVTHAHHRREAMIISHPYRLGERSPGPCASLSVTLVIGIISRPTFDPAPVGHAGAGARYAA
jgi:hypothetical protein